jgi:NADH:ubiquinone oxidoreductase subunit 6 (subunit J)
MEVVIVAVLVGAVLALWIAAISAVVDAARTPADRWRNAQRGKGATIFLILLTGGFGGFYYWWRIRRDLRTAPPSGGQPPAPQLSKAELRAIEGQRYR